MTLEIPDDRKSRRAWAVARWLAWLAVIAAVLYGAWWVASGALARQYFVAGMRDTVGNPARAVKSLTIAARLRPQEAQYRAALGRALLAHQDYAGAVAQLQEAARRKPEDFGLWFDLGEAALKASSPGVATQALQQALKIRPQSAEAMELLAEAAATSGNWSSAVGPLRQLWRKDPENLTAAAQLARALVATQGYGEALKVCADARARLAKRGGRLPSADATAAFLTAEGDACRALKRWSAAVRAYLAALALAPGEAQALAGLSAAPREIARLVTPSGKARGMAFSPDGARLAFYWAGGSGGSGLFVLDPLSEEPRKVAATEGPPEDEPPAWSPDGKRLCYADQGTLCVVTADGSGPRALVKNKLQWPQLIKIKTRIAFSDATSTEKAFPVQGAPAWSPDGKRFAYRASDAQVGCVTCVAVAATGRARSVHRTANGRVQYQGSAAPKWSPDGRVICGPLSYLLPAGDGLTFWSAAGEAERQVQVPAPATELRGRAVTEVAWSPDVVRLAVSVADSGGATRLVLVRADGKGSQTVARRVVPHSPRWIDAQHVWFLTGPARGDLGAAPAAMVCDLQGKVSLAKQAFPVRPVGDWAVSRGGRWLAMASEALTPKGQGRGLWLVGLQAMREETKE